MDGHEGLSEEIEQHLQSKSVECFSTTHALVKVVLLLELFTECVFTVDLHSKPTKRIMVAISTTPKKMCTTWRNFFSDLSPEHDGWMYQGCPVLRRDAEVVPNTMLCQAGPA